MGAREALAAVHDMWTRHIVETTAGSKILAGYVPVFDSTVAARCKAAGMPIIGKTGTAHKVEGKGYAGNKYRAWFVGIAPISKPRIVVAVMVDEPGNGKWFGGDVAAPVFSQVVQQTLARLGVLPDMEVQPKIISTEPAEVESF